MHARRRQLILFVALLALAALLLASCGGGDDRAKRDQATRAARAAESAAEDRAATVDAEENGDDSEDEVVAPTPAAVRSGRRFEALLKAYAPVTTRVDFLVAAETLRQDAVVSGAGDELERERFGAVRLEIERMSRLLRQTRPRVAAVSTTSVAQEHVQDDMLAAIDARLRALTELEAALDALGNEKASASEAEALEDRWRASWDESLRYAREATTTMQDARAMLGLEPAPEDGIR